MWRYFERPLNDLKRYVPYVGPSRLGTHLVDVLWRKRRPSDPAGPTQNPTSQNRCCYQVARLIWNDPLSSPDLSMVAWRSPSKRQLAGMRASDHVVGAVSRGAEGAARGREALDAVSATWYLRRVGARAAETTDARGRFDDESR